MDDINFEELDKAVNSALQKPTDDPAQDDQVSSVATQPVSDQPLPEAPEPAPQNVVPQRRGQFMDMVHPSSDMITSTAPRQNRQAATIQPLNPAVVETAQPVGVVVPKLSEELPPAETVVEPEISNETEEVPTKRSEWPDPLDIMEQTEHEKLGEASEVLDDVSTESAESDVSVENNDEIATDELIDDLSSASEEVEEDIPDVPEIPEEAPVSPFVSGGPEIEKRPLGAFTNTSTEPSDGTVVDSETSEITEETQLEDTPEGEVKEELPAVPVPQELTPEVVSVESDNPNQLLSGAAEETAGSDTVAPEAVGMATSIPPQYKNTEAPSDDQGDHPVFDTKDYHQPLTPPAKHSHTGLIVALVIVVLALLGAGAWYAIAVLKLI